MARLILRYNGSDARPAADVEHIRAAPGLSVLGDSGRMLLVDVPEHAIPKLKESLGGWTVSPETSVPLPDTRQSVKKPETP